jgi:PhnB protein
MLSDDKKKAPTAGFLVVPNLDDAVAYYTRVFGATEAERYQDTRGKVWYAVIHIFDLPIQLMEPFPSMGLFAPATPDGSTADASALVVNLRDVDAAFNTAIRSGSTPIIAPQHNPIDGTRSSDFRDPFGHRWQIRLDTKPAVVPALVVPNLDQAVQFNVSVFKASEKQRVVHPVDKKAQSTITVGSGSMLLLEASPARSLAPLPISTTYRDSSMLALTVPDLDATYTAAIKAGATPIITPHDAYWGDRYAEFRLPFSPIRAAGCGVEETPIGVSPTEMQKTFNKFLVDNNNPLSPAEVIGDKMVTS